MSILIHVLPSWKRPRLPYPPPNSNASVKHRPRITPCPRDADCLYCPGPLCAFYFLAGADIYIIFRNYGLPPFSLASLLFMGFVFVRCGLALQLAGLFSMLSPFHLRPSYTSKKEQPVHPPDALRCTACFTCDGFLPRVEESKLVLSRALGFVLF